VAALSAVAGCKSEKAPQPGVPAPARSALPETVDSRLNVLMITVDAMRADMPWQGYPRPIAPRLSELAAESVVYTNAYAVSSDTAKSVPAMLTGRYPSALYRSGWFFAGYAQSNVFAAEVLQAAGIRTIGWHAHPYFNHAKGLSQGFDVWELVPGLVFDPKADRTVTSPALTAMGTELLAKPENAEKQFFAWSHYTDPHEEYLKHAECPDWGNGPRDRYDSEICFTDLWIGRLLDWAATKPWWKNTAVIVTSDHGEAFGEHAMTRHAFNLWQVLVRVPLMIKVPGAKPKRIDRPRSQIDLAATIADLMGVKLPDAFMGRSLVAEIRGLAEPDDREPIVLDLPEDTDNPPLRAIIEGGYKLTASGKQRYLMFDLTKDPAEEHDLARRDPNALARMKQRFVEVSARIPEVEPFGGMKLSSGRMANGAMQPAASAQGAQ
jgi:choline-sulfatase